MQCLMCGSEMRLAYANQVVCKDGKKLGTVHSTFYQCPICGQEVLTSEQAKAVERKLIMIRRAGL